MCVVPEWRQDALLLGFCFLNIQWFSIYFLLPSVFLVWFLSEGKILYSHVFVLSQFPVVLNLLILASVFLVRFLREGRDTLLSFLTLFFSLSCGPRFPFFCQHFYSIFCHFFLLCNLSYSFVLLSSYYFPPHSTFSFPSLKVSCIFRVLICHIDIYPEVYLVMLTLLIPTHDNPWRPALKSTLG